MIQLARLGYQRDLGPHLSIEKAPLFWVIMEHLGDVMFSRATFHLFCCKVPEWAFHVRWGKLDDDGYTDKCLGHLMFSFGNWLILGFNAYKHFRTVGTVPVSPDWVRAHYPDVDPIFTGEIISPDAMVSEAGDPGDITL